MSHLTLLSAMGWRNLWRNPRRTGITFIAITLGVWSMITLASLMDAWAASTFDASIKTLLGHGQIHAPLYMDDPSIEHRFKMLTPEQDRAKHISQIMQQQGISDWAARINVPAIVQSERESAPVSLVGIMPDRELSLSFVATAVKQGKFLEHNNDNGIILGKKLSQRLRTGLNKRIVLMSQDSDGFIAERGFRVTGIFEADQKTTESQYVFVSLEQAQRLLNVQNEISEVSFMLHDIDRLPTMIDILREQLPHLNVQSWYELEPFTLAILDMTDGSIAIWTVTMFILVALGLINTLLMAVFERTREFGLLQALGLRPRFILLQVLIESIFLIGLGVVAGLLTAALTIQLFDQGLDLGALAEGATTFGAGRVLYPLIDWLQALTICLFVWFTGIFVSLYPAWHAAREVPVAMINKSY